MTLHTSAGANVTRAWAETPFGRVHYATAGDGPFVLLLHQTPRSWLEFVDVIPLLAPSFRVVAMDTLGFGDSDRPEGETLTIDLMARGAVALLDALEIPRCALVGHHTGGIIGVELLATAASRFTRAVLSATPFIDSAWRARIGTEARIDSVTPKIDGSHLLELWGGRQPFYPSDRIDLLERFVVDALRSKWNPADGHVAVQTYRMENKVADIVAPVLLVAPMADPFVNTEVPRLGEVLGAEVVEVAGGMIPLPDHMPVEFAEIVTRFLD